MPVRHRELRLNGCSLSLLPPRDLAALDDDAYDAKLAAVQRLRGRVYLADGAIPASALDATGRHRSDVDPLSWHVLAERRDGSLCGCIRTTVHSTVEELESGPLFRLLNRTAPDVRAAHLAAIHAAIDVSGDHRSFEVGGWATDENERRSLLPVYLALSCWSMIRLQGLTVAFAATTDRHGSSSMLVRLGMFPVRHDERPLTPFHDSAYGCWMQILQATDQPAPAYDDVVCRLEEQLLPLVASRCRRGTHLPRQIIAS